MSIGNGLSFSQAAALAGINPSNLNMFFGSAGTSDTTTQSSVNSLTNSRAYTPQNYTPTPIPSFNTINQVTGNGFGSSTNTFFTPSNSIFTNTNTNTNSFSGNLPAVKTPSKVTNTGGENTVTTGGKTSTASRDVTKLPPVDKSALLDVSADAGPSPSSGKVNLGADPVA